MQNTRRHLLRSVLGLAAVPAVMAPAAALTIEDMDVPRQRLLLSDCETRSAHQQQFAALVAELEGRGVAETRAVEIAKGSNCPFCGCSLNLAALGEIPDKSEPPKF
ncbi:MAG: hypothetical protein LCH62_15285 [Proteobacteria bacterium]|nr:hypothetical protein [Pseudomonadota bacterium]